MSARFAILHGYAAVDGLISFAAVVNLISYAVAVVAKPVISSGEGVPNQLIDGETGALLFDADTGAAIVW